MQQLQSDVTAKLDRIAERFAQRSDVHELQLRITQPSTGLEWSFGEPKQYFIASVTKLYTTAIVLQLRASGDLTFDTPAADILGADTLAGLNTFGGIDRAADITIGHLLSHTSGIPDYFEGAPKGGESVMARMLRDDVRWSFDDAVGTSRQLPAPFAPGTPGKALYSDTNFQLLGKVIETVTAGSYEAGVDERVIRRLGLDDTYLFTESTLDRADTVSSFLNGRAPLPRPQAMASFGPDGSIVSTTDDGIEFLRAFLTGDLFPVEYIDELTATWRTVFTPLEYGIGIMRFALPRILSPFAPVPAMIGHSGASGSVLYRVPDLDLYLCGTVNQVKNRSLPYRLMATLVNALR
ncbi:serine hydrolase domain-containing protein [Cryobacterium sp. BB307]|uniref:serine hydrolase domain-containing protein n=1 Tax=Cryobacterium sp. BB307 TaxID=2716317 RepID=UPI001B2FE73E|nr:serine hydrolase domain-containing protein [Cryobacterium sp. BB307]